jgi:hypothetical protein
MCQDSLLYSFIGGVRGVYYSFIKGCQDSLFYSLIDPCQDSSSWGVKGECFVCLASKTEAPQSLKQWDPPSHTNTTSYPKVLESSSSNRFAYFNRINKVKINQNAFHHWLLVANKKKLSVGCKAQHSISIYRQYNFNRSFYHM